VAVTTVLLPCVVADLGTVGEKYCCSNTEVSLIVEKMNILSSLREVNARRASVIICSYSPSKRRVAAIRTTGKKAVTFMLLEC